jgi:hypothetical protein
VACTTSRGATGAARRTKVIVAKAALASLVTAGILGPYSSELAEPARERTTRGDGESRTSDESYRDGLREGLREGYREGYRESRGQDEGYADRAGSAEGAERSGTPPDRSEEAQGTLQRSDEGEESGVARV